MLPTRLSPRSLRALTPLRIFSRPASFKPKASPPRLPDSEQLEFERLQRSAAVSSAFQPSDTTNTHTNSDATSTSSPSTSTNNANAVKADKDTDADELHPAVFRGAKPEFEGDTNPKTGEVGGPKNEPLRWGGGGDWSYNGRVTDF